LQASATIPTPFIQVGGICGAIDAADPTSRCEPGCGVLFVSPAVTSRVGGIFSFTLRETSNRRANV